MCKVSILTVVKDCEDFIAEAIDSVLRQTFEDFEYIIIDDGSSDKTVEIIKSYNDKRVKLHKNDKGYISSLNLGIDRCKGNFIARLDADDIMHSQRLSIQYERMIQNPEIDICGSWVSLICGRKVSGYIKKKRGFIDEPFKNLILENFFSHSSVMFKKQFLNQKHCQYRDNYKYCEDYDLWCQMAKNNAKFFMEPQILTGIRIHGRQVSQLKEVEMRDSSIILRYEMLKTILFENNLHEIATSIKPIISRVRNVSSISADDTFDYFIKLIYPNTNSPKYENELSSDIAFVL